MPVGLKDSVQIVGYVDPELKERAERVKEHDRRMTISRLIEEALVDYLPKVEPRRASEGPSGSIHQGKSRTHKGARSLKEQALAYA